ncbi:MAG: glycoside hydrolase family 97 protein [Sphingomonas sp.]|nr:glycoside hydrolase family 97 protein [Sphingomonas sp.]
MPAVAALTGKAAAKRISESVVVESPDGKIEIRFGLFEKNGKQAVPCYSLFYNRKALILRASVGLELASGGPLDSQLKIVNVALNQHDETYAVLTGKTSAARDHYRETTVSLEEQAEPRRRLDLIFRAYDDGAAFRYRVPAQPALSELIITAERSTFAFVGNPTAYSLPLPFFRSPYEVHYEILELSNITPDSLIGTPMLLEYPDKIWVGITEAALTNYAGMYLSGLVDSPGVLTSLLSPRFDDPQIKVKARLPHASPWRVLMIADDPGRLIESNIVTNLNSPSVLKDTSWIKPGKTTFPWWNGYDVENENFTGGLNTATMKYYIDFCAEHGIEYHSLDGFDEAWYGGPISYQGGDITKSVPAIDLPAAITYARQKGVGLRLWLHSAAAKAHMKTAFPIYEQWGIEGVMVDFFDRDDQETVVFIDELLQLAMKHHLTVTLHNVYKPSGLSRTYPNLLAVEAAFNTEYNKWDARGSTPEHEMLIPFVRMLAGGVDFHSGSFRNVTVKQFFPRNIAPMTMGTRVRQMARYVVYEDALPMIVDSPSVYRGQDSLGLDFIVKIPTTWDETRVLAGSVGRCITVARRRGRKWYVGSMTDGSARQISIPLRFIGNGNFTAEIYSDDPAAPDQPTKLLRETRNVTSADTIHAGLASAGGHIIQLTPDRMGARAS